MRLRQRSRYRGGWSGGFTDIASYKEGHHYTTKACDVQGNGEDSDLQSKRPASASLYKVPNARCYVPYSFMPQAPRPPGIPQVPPAPAAQAAIARAGVELLDTPKRESCCSRFEPRQSGHCTVREPVTRASNRLRQSLQIYSNRGMRTSPTTRAIPVAYFEEAGCAPDFSMIA